MIVFFDILFLFISAIVFAYVYTREKITSNESSPPKGHWGRYVLYFSFTIIFIVVGVFLALTTFIQWQVNMGAEGRVRSAIPSKIVTTEVLANDFDTLGGGELCGGVAFKISDETLDKIEKDGISFFQEVIPYTPTTYNKGKTHRWHSWSQASLSEIGPEYSLIPFDCLNKLKKYMQDQGYVVTQHPVGYYTYVTHVGYSSLWVIPDWGMVVYSQREN